MANQYYISAGITPIDNSSGATSNNYYISAGIVPDDTAAPTGASPTSVFYGPLVGPLGGPL